ncbi:MAG: DUF3613 domain-containing protein [Nevskia sp.]|nr:DUF3613 domain-containing protein [Nevskia sp.]
MRIEMILAVCAFLLGASAAAVADGTAAAATESAPPAQDQSAAPAPAAEAAQGPSEETASAPSGAAESPSAGPAEPTAAAPVQEGGFGSETNAWLAAQIASTSGTPRPMPGEVASRVYQRYLDSFTHPIPEEYGRQGFIGGGGSASSSGP